MAREAAGTKKQRDQLRASMGDHGCTREQITAEMARCFGFRARQAWRHTHGWTQDEVAAAYNRLLGHDQAPMTGKRISDFEAWPHGGVKPTTTTLAILATLYCTTPSKLVDLDDRQALSTQELIALDTTTPQPPATPQLCDSTESGSARGALTGSQSPVVPSSDMFAMTGRWDHTPEGAGHTPDRLTMGIPPLSPRRRWPLVLACVLAVVIVICDVILTRRAAVPDVHLVAPTPVGSPSVSSSPTASSPPSPALLVPPVPLQTTRSSPTPVSVSMQALPAPPPPHWVLPGPPVPQAAQAAPLSARPDPPPVSSATTTAAGVSSMWKNMHYDLCLEEMEEDPTGESGGLRVWHCNGTPHQMWTEKIVTDHPLSIAKNLVASGSGHCLTYSPDPDEPIIRPVWLAPCGGDGQGWIRTWNGKAFIFQAAVLPGLCLSVTRGLLAGGFPGIQLRPCDPPSSLTDWLPSPH